MPLNVDPRVGMELGYRDLIFGRLGVYNFQKVSIFKPM